VTGSTPAQKVKDKVPGVNLQEFGTYSECLAGLLGGGVDALTTDDTILAGFAAQEANKGKLKVVGAPFSTERTTASASRRATPPCARRSTTRSRRWSRTVVGEGRGEEPRPGRATSRLRATRPPRPPAPDLTSSEVCRPLPRERAAHLRRTMKGE
jgi:hypothetical protein